eukprot:CAMPEP_0177230544 /NCGR_PEP_ID=MMETSP0367-20130122/42280_1 /TAXON_ID=447022 ORGANISM="Scrippsiella hangoei-like, Strain SHHI-4" /NCGR_SAMPLE_ID=MMETSP0367 /ASSEMBLY_ACC=CAM_ASM_000362 /LENGTH=262 /DNA_ID=CAMNT_0018680999 /DNA_START=60 /DNA_END=848 /DNA_ORIENTATION=-
MAASTGAKLGVVVTGGSSGIGRELVKSLVQRQYAVFAVGRNAAALQALEPLGVGWAAGDVSDAADVERHWAAAQAFFKEKGSQPFGVCLNAGCGAGRMPFEAVEPDQIDRVLNTNIKGVMLWLRAVLPVLKERRQGQVVLTSSAAAMRACPNAALYSASKFAVQGLLLAVRGELKGTGVKLGSVNPGAVATEWWTEPERGGYSEAKVAELQETPLWSAMLAPEAVAAQIVALLEQPPSSNIESVVMDAEDVTGTSPPPAGGR